MSKLCKRSFDIFFSTRISVSALASRYIWIMEWCSTLTLICWFHTLWLRSKLTLHNDCCETLASSDSDMLTLWLCSKLTLHNDCCETLASDAGNLHSFLQLLQTHRNKEVCCLLYCFFFIVFYVLQVKDRKVQNSENCWDWNQSVWWFRACCRNARLTARSANRRLTPTVRLNRCRISRSSVNFN